MSTNLFASAWGADDPLVSVRSVRTTVHGGWPVWPWALHQLLTASNRRAHLERHLAGINVMALPVDPRQQGHGSSMM